MPGWRRQVEQPLRMVVETGEISICRVSFGQRQGPKRSTTSRPCHETRVRWMVTTIQSLSTPPNPAHTQPTPPHPNNSAPHSPHSRSQPTVTHTANNSTYSPQPRTQPTPHPYTARYTAPAHIPILRRIQTWTLHAEVRTRSRLAHRAPLSPKLCVGVDCYPIA